MKPVKDLSYFEKKFFRVKPGKGYDYEKKSFRNLFLMSLKCYKT